eukprot:6921674-Pyramimonas_sp.AAC.2
MYCGAWPDVAPIVKGEREYTRSGLQSRKGRENIPVAGTNRVRGERRCVRKRLSLVVRFSPLRSCAALGAGAEGWFGQVATPTGPQHRLRATNQVAQYVKGVQGLSSDHTGYQRQLR